ncbi:adenylate kinase isoenzyme 5-like [Pempheris klunzingeri]|uniref:adenylate kinase isoenzyme 5-like n=1 Tax=Pempheris klunzingeri TaxID=3127111 RepID=UPI00397ECF97
MSSREVKEYLSHHHLPQLLESLLTGLLYHHPEDPVSFLQSCLITTRQLGGPEAVTWDTFIHLERHHLSPKPPKTTLEPLRATSIPPKTASNNTYTSYTFITSNKIPNTPNNTINTPQNNPYTSYTLNPTNNTCNSINTPENYNSTTYKATNNNPKTPNITSDHSPNNPNIHTPDPKLQPPAPPGLTVTPQLVHTERREQRDTKASSTETPPPGPPPSPVQSQLSIDSDSDMTESSGLLQEVSILPPQRPRPPIIFIIGGPGSGKASQAARLARCFSLRVVSLDELLRRQMLSHASPGRKWEIVSEMMSHGELGPQEETISELRRQLSGQPGVRGFIVDGFPRNVHQALSFQEQIGSPDLVMLLLCSNETLRCRLQRRATQLGLLGDSSHALRRRLEAFQRDIVSISRYYRQLHLLTQVDADRDEEVLFADLNSVIGVKLLRKDSSGID